MKLEVEPRVTAGPNFFAATVDWMRRAARAVNPLDDAIGPIRGGAKSISETLDGPAFHAYRSGAQGFTSGTFVEAVLNTEEFDTNNCFDVATGRFTPNVAGLYLMAGTLTQTGSNLNNMQSFLYKNGTAVRRGDLSLAIAGAWSGNVVGLVQLNGTTDYVTLACYGSTTAGNPSISGGSTLETWMSGFLARRA